MPHPAATQPGTRRPEGGGEVSGRWASSNRRAGLPNDWPTRRRRVKHRARGRCEAKTHESGCDGIGTDCDHIGDPADHSLTNLQWLSRPCHNAKTQREAQAARTPPPARARQPEPHPGRL